MHKMSSKVLFVLILLISGHCDISYGNVDIEDTLNRDSIHLVLNGTGYRTAFGMRMYTGGLYLEQKSNNAQEIIEANKPMAVLMVINSSLITGERLEKSTREGFFNATDGDVSKVKNEMEAFLKLVKTDLCKGDRYLFDYNPQHGTSIVKNGLKLGVIDGLRFKKALFGIWFCSKPPQLELKNGMLGM